MKHWRERFPDIHAEERECWKAKGFKELTSPRGEVSFEGTLTVRRSGDDGLETRQFELRFDYPPAYPFQAPKVSFLQPKIARARHQGTDGAPCLFPASAWDKNVRASELYAATERWLNYHLDNHFPRELALYELPEYFERTTYAVLAPPQALESFAGRDKGHFSVTKLIGQDLCVLRSVDGDGVGKGLISELATKKLWDKFETAKWYRLHGEPNGMQHTGELETLLAASGHRVSFKSRPEVGRDLLGLVFTDEVLGDERLLLIDIGVRSKTQKPKVGEGWPLRVAELHIASREELQRRLRGVRNLDVLAQKKVAFFGLGAIGSPLALSLAREGVGSLDLCDPDSLRPGNIVRHALDLTSVGQGKAIALETALGKISPGVETVPQFQNLSDPAVIDTCIGDADLVIAAIGDEMLEELLCEVAFDREDPPPLILVRSLHAGAAFRVALIRSGRDACFECLLEYKKQGNPDWLEVPDADLPEVFDSGCATAALPGAGLTSQQAAGFAAARALEVLEGRDRDPNHWVSVESPIADGDPRLDQPLALHEFTFKPFPECPACAT